MNCKLTPHFINTVFESWTCPAKTKDSKTTTKHQFSSNIEGK